MFFMQLQGKAVPLLRDSAGSGILRFQLQLFDEKSSGIGFISEFLIEIAGSFPNESTRWHQFEQ